ncbi:DNA helicase-2/ATP-dependent DNA helicase PcrA [Paraburkholderia sp. HC6.4b]|uniref:UvrD-helicase domain-containing protein n=1 Tax=unclassified Paraburkholderia TaxID=2615204 RepID=UPI0016133F2A|nr:MULTISPECIES: UvrD-helicase domain-containing protein [unclassified Paraburkholderia]MBB5412140.1 DNA helicase-2/ATP-dependent DNA helicase PcrA [Paraburkholderia sp. HC6.4b]MBB5454207.1 DNA helicase-2/ATP-dependent DNA helicase PcrA [Paraburkholderia sp. Kb1A]
MLEAEQLLGFSKGAIVAPAGHGKTEQIAKVAALGRRTLILTHTHAGVHAIRSRLKRLKVPHAAAVVDTIAGWSMRYAHAFPGIAQPCEGMPQGAQWDNLYRGTIRALAVGAVRQVVEASYDRILIDEYQDCNGSQHELATTLSAIVPTLIFGDPMQGIFEFAGATLNWETTIFPWFPLVDELDVPHRWRNRNPELGDWIADVRERLMRGEGIDFSVGPVAFRRADTAFDMGPLFDGFDGVQGSVAAVHCNKGICYRLARAAGGGYQAIEEVAARRLQEFCVDWDACDSRQSRVDVITGLVDDCVNVKPLEDGEEDNLADLATNARIRLAVADLFGPSAAEAGATVLSLIPRRARYQLYRRELWRDVERALADVAAGRCVSMTDAAERVRQRASLTGRRLPQRTVSTPLLLKGLEFDHVVVPDAAHFAREQRAQAKLFYVAISRATHSLTISAPDNWVQFQRPDL